MNIDFRISVEFFDHPKTVKLERSLGSEGIKHLLILWAWTAKNKPNGFLSNMNEDDIEIAAKWTKETGAFVKALKNLRFIDQSEDGFSLHNWQRRNPWAAGSETRGDKARFSRLAHINPTLYALLLGKGYRSIGKEEYETLMSKHSKPFNNKKNNDSLTNVNGPYNERSTPAPAPSPNMITPEGEY
ncbi:hypothetical protein [Desulfobacter postgatei]|uniref:hypothetical protein n=1 Tax=Desulfobacter postgatei TaxID=2293 RepID=UPI002FDB05F6